MNISSEKPILAINYKAYYPHSFGKNAVKIAEAAVKVWRETGINIILAPPFTELHKILEIVQDTEILVFAQHADPLEPGAITGYIPLEGLKELGVHGIMVNHSEHRLKLADINYLIKKAKNLGLTVLACADVPETSGAIAMLEPHMIAVEPPELIGTGISVSKAKPEVILNTLNLIRRINPNIIVLTGAGISTGEDIYIAIKLGTQGVLVASAIVKSKDPYAVIKEMAENALKAYFER